MTVVQGFMITITSGILGGMLGSGVGFVLGQIAPDYYRTVFPWISPSADLVQLGVGLGLTQGLAAGLGVGLVIVLAVAWYQSRVRSA